VKGYEVVSSEGEKIGRVSDVLDGFLVVELGGVLRVRRPVPREFTHAQDGDRAVVVTVPKRLLRDAPRVRRDGTFDVVQAGQHYGVGSGRGGEVLAEGTPEHEVAKERERESRETGPEEEDGAAPLTKQPDDEIERRPEQWITPGGK
jgi:hypothetical protein